MQVGAPSDRMQSPTHSSAAPETADLMERKRMGAGAPSAVSGPGRLVLLSFLLGGCGEAPVVDPLEDRTARSGLDFVPVVGATGSFDLPEIMSGGIALFDANRDGALDVLLVNAGEDPRSTRPGRAASPHQLYLGDGSGGLRPGPELPAARGYGMGIAVADFDGDGIEDCYLTARGADALWLGRGDGSFEDVTEAWGVPQDDGWSCSAAAFDHDGDGDLDLYVVRYLTFDPELICHDGAGRPSYCPPQSSPPEPDLLLENRDGAFVDISEQVGLRTAPAGPGLGVVIEDLDGDGDEDIFVANDGEANHLWIRQEDGTYQERAVLAGLAFNQHGHAEAGMGVVSEDFDGDGLVDLFLTHLQEETHTLYRRSGRAWKDRTAQSGLVETTMAFTGFGVGVLDLEPDGAPDLAIANGRVRLGDPVGTLLEAPWSGLAEPDSLLRNAGDGRFLDVADGAMGEARISRGIAVGDLDGDLVPDLVRTHVLSPAQILRVVPTEPLTRRVLVDVRERSGAVALGARVTLESRSEQTRTIRANSGYLCASDPRVLFAALEAAPRFLVRWSDGAQETFGPLTLGQLHTLRRGEGTPR